MNDEISYSTDEDGIVTARIELVTGMGVSGQGKTREEAVTSLARALAIVADMAGIN